MRPSAALALLCLSSPALAGHFDDVIDRHPKPLPCAPDTSALVPNCASDEPRAGDATSVVLSAVAAAPPRDDDDDAPPFEASDERDAETLRLARYHLLGVQIGAAPVRVADRDAPATTSQDAADEPGAAPQSSPSRIDDGALRWQGELALGFGNAVVDGTNVTSWPSLNLAGGIASGRFVALATYTLTAEHYPGSSTLAQTGGTAPAYLDTDGIVHRLGLAGRYSVLHGSTDAGLLGDLWLQGDGGEEFTRWDRGGLLERPYAGVAIGTQGGFASSAHKRHSLYLAVRVQVARRTDLNDALSTCSAPCTEATPPERWSDRSIELRMGFAFGD